MMRQADSNSYWRDQLLHTAPAVPFNAFVTPQREELQLTLRLSHVTPPQFSLEPPADSEDEAPNLKLCSCNDARACVGKLGLNHCLIPCRNPREIITWPIPRSSMYE